MAAARPSLLRIACLFALAALLGAAPAAAHSGGRHPHKSHSGARRKAPSQARRAKQLVGRLMKAHGSKARGKATLAIMRQLHIPVVTAKGKPVVVSPEPNAARNFALYDFEMRGLGDAVGRGAVTDLAGVAANLTKSGLSLDGKGKPFPPNLLRTALLGAVRGAVRNPRSQRSLLPLVIRELGLRGKPHYDLAKRKAPKSIGLDALQAWLIAADIEISVLRHVRSGGASSSAQTQLGGGASQIHFSGLRTLLGPRAHAAGFTDTCERLTKASEKLGKKIEKALGGKIQKWIEGKGVGAIYGRVTKTLGKKLTRWGIKHLPRWAVRGTYHVVRAVNIAKPILDALHGMMLAFSTDVRALHDRVGPVHWLHAAGEAGHSMVFETKVTMLDDYGEVLVKCGSLAGFKLPPPGPVKGVLVVWTEAEATKPLWPDLGSVGCTVVCVTETGADGIARLTFTPNKELVPGVGLQKEESGVVDGTALYQTAGDSGLAEEAAQYLTPKQGSSRWTVTYHEVPKLELRMVARQDETFTNQTEYVNSFGESATTGNGSGNFQISADAPLQTVTTTDGITLWTGDAPINWDDFHYVDADSVSLCQDGRMVSSDETGSAPAPGELVVDSVQPEANLPAPGLAVTMHASLYPTYEVTDSVTPIYPALCAPFTSKYRTKWWTAPYYGLTGPDVRRTSFGSETESPTYRITGWKPGPAIQTGQGLYAYRETSYSRSDAYGQPYSGRVRLELIASPKP